MKISVQIEGADERVYTLDGVARNDLSQLTIAEDLRLGTIIWWRVSEDDD